MIEKTTANVRISAINDETNTDYWETFIRLGSPSHGKSKEVIIQIPNSKDKITVDADTLIDAIRSVAYTKDKTDELFEKFVKFFKESKNE